MTTFSARLNRIFDVRPGEWQLILPLMLVTALSSIGFIWGISVSTAAFLQEVGIASLPLVMIAISIVSLGTISIYTLFVDRISKDTTMALILVVELVALAVGLVFYFQGMSTLAYSLLYFIFYTANSVFYTHLTSYLSNYFDTRASKRVIPIILAGNRIGVIIGGLLLPFLNRILAPMEIIACWMLVHLMAIVIIRRPGFRQPSNDVSQGTRKDGNGRMSLLRETSEGFRYTLHSSFLRWLAIATISVTMAMALLEYQSGKLLLSAFASVDEMANFLALLLVLANVITLPFLLFGLNRIIGRIGVANSSLIFPFTNILVCGGMVAIPGLFMASTAYLHRLTLRATLLLPVEGLLYNVVPMRIKGRVRAFGNGFLTPLGQLFGSLLLLLPWLAGYWFFPVALFALTVIYFICALYVRRRYSLALFRMLEDGDYSCLLDDDSLAFTRIDPATLRLLGKQLHEERDYKHTVFMAQLLSRIGGSESIPLIADSARHSNDPQIRAAMINVLVAADFRSPQLEQLYSELVNDSTAQVRLAAVRGMRLLFAPEDLRLQNQLLLMLHDQDIDVAMEALYGLAQSPDFSEMEQGAAFLEYLLHHSEDRRRIRGIQILGSICTWPGSTATQRLCSFLADPLSTIRLAAVQAVIQLPGLAEQMKNETESKKFAREQRQKLVTMLTPLLEDKNDEIRHNTLTILAYLGGETAFTSLVCGLTDPCDNNRKLSVDLLAGLGMRVEAGLVPLLQSANPKVYRGAAVALARLAPLKHSTYPLIDDTLKIIYHDLACMSVLCNSKGETDSSPSYLASAALNAALLEDILRSRDDIFFLLSAHHESEKLKTVHAALTSGDTSTRANGLEALESMTSPQIVELIAPLLDDRIDFNSVAALAERTWKTESSLTRSLASSLTYLAEQHTDHWVRDLASFVSVEMLAQVNPKEKNPLPEQLLPPAVMGRLRLWSESEDFDVQVAKLRRNIARRFINLVDKNTIIQEKIVLSAIEKVIFLKDVPFFQDMSIEQLGILANACEEVFYPGGERLFKEGDVGGTLYIIVNGRLAIDKEVPGKKMIRLNTIGPFSSLGEATLFDASPRTAGCVALQDSMLLSLGREPLMALAQRHHDLSLRLINVLGEQLRTAYGRIDGMSSDS